MLPLGVFPLRLRRRCWLRRGAGQPMIPTSLALARLPFLLRVFCFCFCMCLFALLVSCAGLHCLLWRPPCLVFARAGRRCTADFTSIHSRGGDRAASAGMARRGLCASACPCDDRPRRTVCFYHRRRYIFACSCPPASLPRRRLRRSTVLPDCASSAPARSSRGSCPEF